MLFYADSSFIYNLLKPKSIIKFISTSFNLLISSNNCRSKINQSITNKMNPINTGMLVTNEQNWRAQKYKEKSKRAPDLQQHQQETLKTISATSNVGQQIKKQQNNTYSSKQHSTKSTTVERTPKQQHHISDDVTRNIQEKPTCLIL